MAQLLIEENFQHLDGQDVELLIEALAELGLAAEPTQPRSVTRSGDWALVLHWLRDDVGKITEDAVAAALVTSVTAVLGQEHAVGPGGTSVRGRTLPVRIDIRGRAGELIKSVAMPGAEAKSAAVPWWRGRHTAAADGAPRLARSTPAAQA
ncbi:hypothetical protein [Kitasatospora kifunensis]|uniref:Uncharacterized protein n=1 Tax=Kitasatospora kifunensis TaxID=58351 RepID=A0A7W7R7H2_KITKI|nr:hypothetical protein [Kitasatospora kifunensis]MBB4926852.1 hypothetical protein [Kitasatospora kifunensis]